MEETYRPGRAERRRRLAARLAPRKPVVQRSTLGWRRAAAVGVLLVLMAVAGIMGEAARSSTAETADWVLTQPHQSAQLSYVRDRGKTHEYRIILDGAETPIDDDSALEGGHVGDAIQYVTAPDDPTWIVAVGEPGAWDPDPIGDRILTAVFRIMAGVASLLVGAKLLPEDLRRITGT